MTQLKLRWGRSVLRIALGVFVVIGVAAFVIRQPAWGRQPRSVAEVEPQRLEAHVRYLAETCFPRDSAHRENLAKAIAYIAEEFRSAGGRVELQEFSTPSGPFQNVIARFGPETGRRIVVGAHFDACGARPGADDNASGVAGLLELAHLLGKEKALPAPVELVAYNLEEPPFFAGPYMGSAVHARRLKAANVPVSLMLSLEMIGCFRDERGSQSYPLPILRLFYPSRGNFIAIVGRWPQRGVVAGFKADCVGSVDLPVVSIAAPAFMQGIDFSDHRNYWAEGYSALMITDTAFLRNPRYHEATDTPDTLDYRRMAEVVRLVHAGVVRHATRTAMENRN
ncbi:MAG: peptidase [Verrucomicrobia bacterium]|nr:peptidase [Verrucomicrobiota bacterium]